MPTDSSCGLKYGAFRWRSPAIWRYNPAPRLSVASTARFSLPWLVRISMGKAFGCGNDFNKSIPLPSGRPCRAKRYRRIYFNVITEFFKRTDQCAPLNHHLMNSKARRIASAWAASSSSSIRVFVSYPYLRSKNLTLLWILVPCYPIVSKGLHQFRKLNEVNRLTR